MNNNLVTGNWNNKATNARCATRSYICSREARELMLYKELKAKYGDK